MRLKGILSDSDQNTPIHIYSNMINYIVRSTLCWLQSANQGFPQQRQMQAQAIQRVHYFQCPNPSSVPRLQANEEQMQREVLALRRGHLN